MTYEEHYTVLELHVFLKQNRDRKIKGRILDGDNKQSTYIPKEDARSPTFRTEFVLLTRIVNF